MFAVALRLVAGLAIGGTAAVWLARRGRTDPARRPTSSGNGQSAEDRALDEAVEDSFPASDPPAFRQSVIAGSPPRDQPSEDEAAEAHPS
jgi:hypothetical protein